jgi:hypothetical protein
MEEIILIGDSFTYNGGKLEHSGWSLLLTEKHNRKRDIINRGFPDYNTRWTREVISKIISTTHKPILHIVFLGTPDCSQNSNITLKEFAQNLNYIVSRLDTKIILVTPPPLHFKTHIISTIDLYRNETFNTAIKYKIKVLDTWEFLSDGDFIDSQKFSTKGNIKFFNKIDSLIDNILPVKEYYIEATGNVKKENDVTVYFGLVVGIMGFLVLCFVLRNMTRLRRVVFCF